MVKIRLKRVGKTKQPSYRVVVADSRSPRDGRIIESIGHYNPRTEPSEVVLDVERAEYWIGQGAQPTDQVRKLISIAKGGDGAAAPAPKARPKKATPAASVEEQPVAEEAEGTDETAEVPEASDQTAAAPEAETSE